MSEILRTSGTPVRYTITAVLEISYVGGEPLAPTEELVADLRDHFKAYLDFAAARYSRRTVARVGFGSVDVTSQVTGPVVEAAMERGERP